MFAKAYEVTSKFTLPVIVSNRYYDGTVTSGLGSFIVINDKGWILTVAHLFQSKLKADLDRLEISKFHEEKEKIINDPSLMDLQRKKKTKTLEGDRIKPKWITNNSLWWGADDFLIEKFEINNELDLAAGQIKNFDPSRISGYPVFRDPSEMKHGSSLCKLGFPFHKVDSSFDPARNAFVIAPNVLPIPRFPLEGIFTRTIHSGKTKDGRFDIKLIETSSPGLMGQSGGPIFDTEGNVWAIQSRTLHMPLGFEPTVKKKGREVTENQFLNVGLGVHVQSMLQFLDSLKIEYNVSGKD
jgi:S1-C subfamily serine protease